MPMGSKETINWVDKRCASEIKAMLSYRGGPELCEHPSVVVLLASPVCVKY